MHGLCESLTFRLGSSIGGNSSSLAPMGTDVVAAKPVKCGPCPPPPPPKPSVFSFQPQQLKTLNFVN